MYTGKISTHCKRTSISARTETTIARDGAIAILGVFYTTDDGQEAIEENEVPQILLQARPAFRHPGYGAIRDDLNVAQKSRGFFGSGRGTSGRDQGPRMKRSSIQRLKLRTRCARCRKLGHWARECPEGNRGQRNDERYDRRAMRSRENSEGFITVAKPTERIPFFLGASWTFVALDNGEVLWDTGAQEGLVGLQVEWSQEKPESASDIGMCQLVWLGATVSFHSLLWRRMSHLYCRWDNEDTSSKSGFD